MPNVFQGMCPQHPTSSSATYIHVLKIFCTLSHTESSAADFSFSSVSPQTVEHTGVCIG